MDQSGTAPLHVRSQSHPGEQRAAYHGVEGVALDALPVVDVVGGVVLAAGGDLEAVAGAGAGVLQPGDVADGVLAGEQRVLAGGLLPAAPPRVPEDVDVGAPEREPRQPHVVHRPRLVRHHLQAKKKSRQNSQSQRANPSENSESIHADADVSNMHANADTVLRLVQPKKRKRSMPARPTGVGIGQYSAQRSLLSPCWIEINHHSIAVARLL
jgi:hypothetical protein